MDFFIKTALVLAFGLVTIQDIKERKVFWFLFPIIGIIAGILHFRDTMTELFLVSVLLNISFVLFLLIIVFLYSRFKLKTSVKNTFGMGDALLFIALAFTFSTVSFLIIFVGALLFSLILHMILNKKKEANTVPLAGYMCLFFILTFICYWNNLIADLYLI